MKDLSICHHLQAGMLCSMNSTSFEYSGTIMVTDSLLRSVCHEEVTSLLALWVTPQVLLSFWLVAKSLFEECCLNKCQYSLHERNDRNVGI